MVKIIALWCLLFVCAVSSAEPLLDKPIKIIVPFAPGGTTDLVIKLIVADLESELKQEIEIVNKAGQGGVAGAVEVARSESDGYILGMATASTTATNPALNKNLPYDPLKDFATIVNIAATPNVLSVHPAFPARDFVGFVEELKRNPSKYAYASTGYGGIAHLQMELLKALTSTKIGHISYRGGAPALNDVMTGQVTIIYDNIPSSMPFITTRRIVPLAVAAPQRIPSLPGVPTFKELGYESMNRMAYYGLVGPKNIPPAVIEKVNSAVNRVLKKPAIKKQFAAMGAIPLGGTPQDFTEMIKTELSVYRYIVEKQNLTIE